MSSIGAALLDSLSSIERSGDFCIGSVRPIFMPTIDIDGIGRLSFPILPSQAEQLVAHAEAAPYGRGEETVIDRTVRRTWQMDVRKIRVAGRTWADTLAAIVADVARGLGVADPVDASLYKLLVYDEGSFFTHHRDTEKVDGMFATMVLVLPSVHDGGALVVKHLDRDVILDPRPEEPSEIGVAAFYADCVHEVRPITAGHRVTLVYNLRFRGKRTALPAPDYRTEQKRAVDLLRRWAKSKGKPDKLILPLEHAYTPAELSFATLKGADAGLATTLVRAAADADCEIHLSLVTIEEWGSAESTGYYGRRRRGRGKDQDEDDDEFEVIEVTDSSLLLSEWRHPDGKAADLERLPFDEGELCPSDAFEDLTPDEQYFHEATGNEGASFERTYRRAGLVLWPRARRLAVLSQAGLAVTLPYLEDLTARWDASGAAAGSALRLEADELSGHILASWPSWRGEEDVDATRMLAVQARLGNVPRIEAFLADQSAKGHYGRRDNAAIVDAATLLPPQRATELLIQIVSHNAAIHLGSCVDLLLSCIAAPKGSAGDAAQICMALLDVLPGDPKKLPARAISWIEREPVTPDLVADLLTATGRIDTSLVARAIEHMLAWPVAYPMDKILVPAALALTGRANTAQPAIGRLREAALQHLQRRVAEPIEPPKDLSRANPLNCSCQDCRALGAFLLAPGQREWRLKAIEAKRKHVQDSVRNKTCDIDLTTDTRGSPYTLIATKNQASYERRMQQRRQDLEHLAALGG